MDNNKNTILSHRGYSVPLKELTPTELAKYKRELTIVPYVEKQEYQNSVEPIEIYQCTSLRFYGPKYWGLNTFGPAKQDKLAESQPDRISNLCKFQGEPRPHQLPVIEKTLEELKSDRGGILALSCGFGKTAIALYISWKIGYKTLVVSHTTTLMQQWVERIKQFIPQARIGIIQQAKADITNKDIVIASLKTLALKDFPKGFFDSFGLVVWDEVHLMATQLFSNAFPKCATKYAIGLSATPYRKDKCDVIFQNYIGPVIFVSKRDKDDAIKAQCITMILPDKELDNLIKYNFKGEILYTSSVVNVVNHPKRTDRIVDLITQHALQGRKILVLSEYVKHLKDTFAKLKTKHETIIEKNITLLKQQIITKIPKDIINIIFRLYSKNISLFTFGLYVGEMKNEDRKISEDKDIILGTYKLASVGMDIPKLNTLIMASPRKDIEQSVGRILRKDTKSGAQNPLIIEIIDNHGIFANQARLRKEFYKEYGYNIENMKMNVTTGEIIQKKQTKLTNSKQIKCMDLSSFVCDNNNNDNGFLFSD